MKLTGLVSFQLYCVWGFTYMHVGVYVHLRRTYDIQPGILERMFD